MLAAVPPQLLSVPRTMVSAVVPVPCIPGCEIFKQPDTMKVPPYVNTVFEDMLMLPLTKVTCPAEGETGCSAAVSQPDGQLIYLTLALTVEAACHAAALDSWSIAPWEAKKPLVTPGGAFCCMYVGFGVLAPSPYAQGEGSAPLQT